MELHKAIKAIIEKFGTDILSDRKFVNVLLDYYHFDVPAKKRIVATSVEDGQLKKLANCGDVMLEINNIASYEFRINGFNEDLTKDVLVEFAKGLGKTVNVHKANLQKQNPPKRVPNSLIHEIEVTNIVTIEDIINGNYPSRGISNMSLMVLDFIFDTTNPCIDGDNFILKKKYGKGFEIYKNNSIKNHFCSFRLAFCYLNGVGTPQNFALAKLELEKHSSADCVAQYGLGLLYEMRHTNASDYMTSVKWYLKSAEKDFSPSQTNLGICYYRGKGVAVDYKEAVKWFKKAVKQGNDCAQAYLGNCYLNGLGVRKNVSEAIQLFIKSSEKHHILGEYYLGMCYENGIGVIQNKDEAIKLYTSSAAQGLQEAKDRLAILV